MPGVVLLCGAINGPQSEFGMEVPLEGGTLCCCASHSILGIVNGVSSEHVFFFFFAIFLYITNINLSVFG